MLSAFRYHNSIFEHMKVARRAGTEKSPRHISVGGGGGGATPRPYNLCFTSYIPRHYSVLCRQIKWLPGPSPTMCLWQLLVPPSSPCFGFVLHLSVVGLCVIMLITILRCQHYLPNNRPSVCGRTSHLALWKKLSKIFLDPPLTVSVWQKTKWSTEPLHKLQILRPRPNVLAYVCVILLSPSRSLFVIKCQPANNRCDFHPPITGLGGGS